MQKEMTLNLFCQDALYAQIRELLHDLPHLFITGPQGCGKTIFIDDILQLIKKEASFTIESIFYLSSEKDRGIHTIRDKVSDYCKRALSKPNSLRFIIIDDCDSLPLISQQALRRPMETYSHLTKFIFASRSSSNLIEPIKSRCYSIEIEPITPHDAFNIYCDKINLKRNQEFFNFLISNFLGLYELKCIINLYKYFLDEKKYSSTEILNEIKNLLSSSTPYTIQLVQAIYDKDENKIRESITSLYLEGFLLDDILLSVEKHIKIFPSINPENRFRIINFVMLGWISIQQGKEHWLDTIDLIEQILESP
jgi:DNA polymerase III delta prime subunit